MPRISTQRACSRSNRARASRGRPAEHRRPATAAAPAAGAQLLRRPPVAWTFASMAARNRGIGRPGPRDRSARRPRRAAAGRRRAASTRQRPRRRGRTAGSIGTGTPPSGSRSYHRRRAAACSRHERSRVGVSHALSRPRGSSVASVSMISRISNTRSMNAGSRCISFGGRSGAGTAISLQDRARRRREHVDAIAEIDGFLDRVRDEEHRRLRLPPQARPAAPACAAASSDRARRTARPSG